MKTLGIGLVGARDGTRMPLANYAEPSRDIVEVREIFFRRNHPMTSRLMLALVVCLVFNTLRAADMNAPGNTNIAPYILTPPAPATPRINGANIFGVRPGSPFLFTIPATGERPMIFSADKLPRGLKLDSKTGRITGTFKSKGEFAVTLH